MGSGFARRMDHLGTEKLMTRYHIEWQMGGEMILDYPDDDAPSNLSDFVLTVLDSKANDVADDVADDAGAHLHSGDGTAEISFARLPETPRPDEKTG